MDLREKMKKVTDGVVKVGKVANDFVAQKIREYEEKSSFSDRIEDEDFEEVVRRYEELESFDNESFQEIDDKKIEEDIFDGLDYSFDLEKIKKELMKYGKSLSDLEILKRIKIYGKSLENSEILQQLKSSEMLRFMDVLKGNVYRFHCLSLSNKYYDFTNKAKSEQVYESFLLPKGMQKEDGFKVLSYLAQYIDKNSNLLDGGC